MTSFDALYHLAAANQGGVEALENRLPQPKTVAQLKRLSDDRYLSMMARCIFRAGFVWRVIDNKWPGFEGALPNLTHWLWHTLATKNWSC